MIQIKINGVEHTFNGDPEMPLLWYVRDAKERDWASPCIEAF